jgi:MFS family permease
VAPSAAERPDRWRQSLFAICAMQFAATVAFSSAFPFLPLYLLELGIRDRGENAIWAGALISGTAFIMALIAPVWGAVADRFGPKLMVTRVLADHFGFRPTFLFTGLLCVAAMLIVVFLVEEHFTPSAPAKSHASFRDRVAEMAGNRQLMTVAGALGAIQFASLLLPPVMPLYVQSLGVDPRDVASAAGLLLAAARCPAPSPPPTPAESRTASA